jgi:hypothetical protein
MLDQLTQPAQFIVGHERELLIWTHGVGWTLALRRSRIQNALDALSRKLGIREKQDTNDTADER